MTNTDDKINPSHYKKGNIEVIDFIEDQGLGEGFVLGNALKYICRAGAKNPAEETIDLEKAVWYIQRRIKQLGGRAPAQSERIEITSPSSQARRYISWDEFVEATTKIAHAVGPDKPSLLIAVSRGGLIPAALLAHIWGIQRTLSACIWTYAGQEQVDREGWNLERVFEAVKDWGPEETLIVDDICDSGATMNYIRSQLPGVLTAATYYRKGSDANVDIFGELIEDSSWIVFPWERT